MLFYEGGRPIRWDLEEGLRWVRSSRWRREEEVVVVVEAEAAAARDWASWSSSLSSILTSILLGFFVSIFFSSIKGSRSGLCGHRC